MEIKKTNRLFGFIGRRSDRGFFSSVVTNDLNLMARYVSFMMEVHLWIGKTELSWVISKRFAMPY
jgi:hypothetical protein